jgi:DNA-binding LacI/PurR family transcriptional regulator
MDADWALVMILSEPTLEPLRVQISDALPFQSASAVVVEGLRGLIVDGTLGTGSVIPSERSLAAHFKVTRKAVRRALTLLTENGVVQSHGSRARTVSPTASRTLSPARAIPRRSAVLQHCMIVLAPPVHDDRRGFMTAIISGVSAGIRQAGFDAINIHPNKIADDLIDPSVVDLLRLSPAGLLIPEFRNQAISAKLSAVCVEHGVPVVAYGSLPELQRFDRVVSDHESGSYQLTRWLASRSRKRILQIGTSVPNHWFAARRAGFERAIREANLELLPPEPIITRLMDLSGWTEAYFHEATRHTAGYLFPFVLGPNPVDAIVAITDSGAHQSIAACEFLGKTPQKDVFVVGYDNNWANSPDAQSVGHPVIATIDKLNYECGMEMVKLLLQRINGELPPEPQTRVVQPQLIIIEADQ